MNTNQSRNKLFSDLKNMVTMASNYVKVASETGAWEVAYDLIFSDFLSKQVYKIIEQLGLRFEYYDPDGSYQDDATAFVDALGDFIKKHEPFFNRCNHE